MSKFRDSYHLLGSRSHEKNAENAILWTIQHYFLTDGSEDEVTIYNALNNMRKAPGIMAQHPSKSLIGHDRFMSHDNLTPVMMFSIYNNSYFHKELWKEIKRQWFRYNNVDIPETFEEKLKNPRFLHPRDVLFYGHLCGCFLWKLLAPLTLFFMLFSVKKKKGSVMKTDDDLLNFVKLAALKDRSWFWNKVWKFNLWKVKREFGSYHKVFSIYFPEEDHPNRVDSRHF